MVNINEQNNKTFYTTIPENWYQALPYGFRITLKDGSSYTMFLPISPSNLNISTNFATNMVPTLYGTVEEHSDVRYFDISIEGTTGIAPKYTEAISNKPAFGPPTTASNLTNQGENINLGKQSFSITKRINLGGFFSKTLGAINQVKNKALNAIDAINSNDKPNPAAFPNTQTGYVAFHNLYKMLLKYKRDISDSAGTPLKLSAAGGLAGAVGGLSIPRLSKAKSSEVKVHPLVFFNYKDGNEYNVVIRSFNMRRSADNPLLYNYSIIMRGYALSPIAKPLSISQENRLEQLGLAGVNGSSIYSKMRNISSSLKGVVGAAVGGVNILGR
jgi:hypothetical protein